MKEIKSHRVFRFRNSLLFTVFAFCIMLFFGQTLSANVKAIDKIHTIFQRESIVLVGKVINHEDVAIEGVIVTYNDSKNSTTTNDEGKFRLTLNEPSLVSFSKDGFKTLNYKFSKTDSSLVVVLSRESNEVIVHGFNSMKNIRSKSELTINVSDSIESDSTERNPLYIIDDVELAPGSDLKIFDDKYIESITVLKNESATELFGERGRNGVVKITTTPEYRRLNPKSIEVTKTDTTKVKIKIGE